MVNVQATPGPIARASGKSGLGLALLLVAAPLPALALAGSLDQKRRDGTIQAALDYVAAHAVALNPTVVALLDAKLTGERIFLFVLLADREGERMIRLLLQERSASRRSKARESTTGNAGRRILAETRVRRFPRPDEVVARVRAMQPSRIP